VPITCEEFERKRVSAIPALSDREVIMKILIADDHELQRKVLRARLQRRGHTVVEASDGVEALEILMEADIQAVISDVLMPKMDGYELCQKIRTSSKRRVPVIMYSGIYTSSDDEKTAIASGADAFFRKPVAEAVICKALEDLAGRKKKSKSARKLSGKSSTVLKEYSARLVEKLEESVAELEIQKMEIEESERSFRTVVKTVAAAIIIYKPSAILYVNSMAEELTGYSAEELLRMPPLQLIAPEDRELAKRRFFMGDGIVETSSRIELRITPKGGGVRWLDFSACTIDYEGSRAVIGTALDITKRKSAESSLKK
jgi:PAS domain S-box-containing protein